MGLTGAESMGMGSQFQTAMEAAEADKHPCNTVNALLLGMNR